MARPWCDIDADVKPWLKIDASNTDHDAVLVVIRDAIEQAVVNYVEHEFEPTVDSEILDSTKSDVITPPNWPIISVENLYFWTKIDGTNGQLIATDQYTVRDYGVVLSQPSPRGRGRVKLEYTWGYASLPADVKLMVLQSVEAEFRRKGRKSIGSGGRSKKDETEGGGGADYTAWDPKTGLPKEVVGKLNTYKQGPEFTASPMATRNW